MLQWLKRKKPPEPIYERIVKEGLFYRITRVDFSNYHYWEIYIYDYKIDDYRHIARAIKSEDLAWEVLLDFIISRPYVTAKNKHLAQCLKEFLNNKENRFHEHRNCPDPEQCFKDLSILFN